MFMKSIATTNVQVQKSWIFYQAEGYLPFWEKEGGARFGSSYLSIM